MKGKDPEKLLWHTQEGITVKPIYTKEDIDALPAGKYICHSTLVPGKHYVFEEL